MPEIKVRPSIRVEDSKSERLKKWQNFLVEVGNRKTDGNQFSLPAEDAGQVTGLVSLFQKNLLDMEEKGVLETLDKMADKIEERQERNMRVAGKDSRESEQDLFVELVRDYLPKVEIKKDNRNELYVSTYGHGLKALGKKELMKIFSGRKGENLKNFDDGFFLSAKRITIFNAEGGDQRIAEVIKWPDAEGLSFGLVSPPILDIINRPRRNIWGKPEPIIPFGGLRIWERSGQDSDNQVPDKAVVILKNPNDWVDLMNELKDEFGSEATSRDKITSAAPIDWGTFVRCGVLENIKVGRVNLMDVLVKRTIVAEKKAAEVEIQASEPRIRRRRRFW